MATAPNPWAKRPDVSADNPLRTPRHGDDKPADRDKDKEGDK